MTATGTTRYRWLWGVLGLVLAFLVLNIHITYANPPAIAPTDGYAITWSTFDGGGAQTVTNGAYTLSGTAGQYDSVRGSQASYTLNGGFWRGLIVEIFGNKLYVPLISR